MADIGKQIPLTNVLMATICNIRIYEFNCLFTYRFTDFSFNFLIGFVNCSKFIRMRNSVYQNFF
jgi:hypothetical protein